MAFVTTVSLRCGISPTSFTSTNRTLLNRSQQNVFARPSFQQQRSRILRTSSTTRTTTMQVGVGSELPTFSLPTDGGKTMASADLASGTTVLYFYPKDATPGCTTESQDFRDMHGTLREMGVSVVGVSKDSVESHDKFVADLGLPFALISDDGTLCEAFGVWKLRKKGDREFMGIERSTFVIKDGKVVKEWRAISAGGHAADVLEALKAM